VDDAQGRSGRPEGQAAVDPPDLRSLCRRCGGRSGCRSVWQPHRASRDPSATCSGRDSVGRGRLAAPAAAADPLDSATRASGHCNADVSASDPAPAGVLDRQGCALLQPYDMEVGAGTSHTATFLRALGPEPWRAAYVQPSRRPKDGRYGENPNRMQHYYQYQVVLKPSPANILDLYLGSLAALGFDLRANDVRLSRTTGRTRRSARGARLGGVAERHGGHAVHLLPAGRRHRLQPDHRGDHVRAGAPRDVPAGRGERVRPGVDPWRRGDRRAAPAAALVRDVFHQNEVEQSTYNFEQSNVPRPLRALRALRGRSAAAARGEAAVAGLRDDPQAAHTFNLLDARGAISVTERAATSPHPQPVAAGRDRLRRVARGAGLPMLPDEHRARGRDDGAATLTVELFTEELPPKALKALGDAFARPCRRARRPRLPRRGRRHHAFRDAATARRDDHARAPRSRPMPRSPKKLMPAKVALGADGSRRRRSRRRWRPSPAPTSSRRRSTPRTAPTGCRAVGRQGRLRVPAHARQGASLAQGCQEVLDALLEKLPIPKVMRYPRRDGYFNDVAFVRPAHRLVALHATSSCRSRRSASPPATAPAATASSAAPTSRSRVPTPTSPRSRPRARSSPRSRNVGPRSSTHSPRRPGVDGDHARRAAGRGDRAGRVAGRLCRRSTARSSPCRRSA